MEESKKKKLAMYLSIAMVFAMLMGPGPGLRLVNPDIESASPNLTVGGLPIIYLWGLFWFAVQVIIVVVAYYTVWNEQDKVVG
ncbi:MAG: hypothetical protein KTR29_13690 [Rhodothermaceae bacterium]|nr:hypothetical protein [Rhodothermaceae bacterium]